jgi:hypothetical protein
MMTNADRLIWLMAVFGLAIMFKACEAEAGPKELHKYATTLGVKPPTSLMAAISKSAKIHGLSEMEMLRVAFVESSLNPRAYNYNTNGTEDVGAFQINTVIANGECQEYNIYNVLGNAMCAGRVMARHRTSGDPFYIGRYHNMKPNLKLKYYKKVEAVR